MQELTNGGLLAFSIDVPNGAESTVQSLRSLFQQSSVSATWAVPRPAESAAATAILSNGGRNEIALLGDPSWVGREAGRTRFAREISRRVIESRANGIDVSTLVIQDVDLDGNLDVLVKHRISAVRGGDKLRPTAKRLVRPYSLRFGIWQISTSHWLPGKAQWWQGGDSFAIKRAISRASLEGNFVHVAIDAARLCGGKDAIRSVERIVSHASQQRERGLLNIDTLSRVAHAMSRSNQAPATGSVLRAA